MADADEDRPNSVSPSQDHDLSEETQDFRFLNSITSSSSSSQFPSLPKRGEKDFEPNPTLSQASTLSASRDAMHAALSHQRLHSDKNHVIAQYCPETPRGDACVRVFNYHGPYFRTIGTSDARNRMWLLPEEALYLLERGSLDIRWPDRRTGQDAGEIKVEEETIGDLPMSLQGAYASFIGKSGLTLERYSVFASLRRSGYTVIRAPTWSAGDARLNGHATRPPDSREVTIGKTFARENSGGGPGGLINRLMRYLFRSDYESRACPSLGPLVGPGLYRSYNNIYRALALIPSHNSTSTANPQEYVESAPDRPQPPFCITYHVYKPSTTYRKSNPPEPDFWVAVVNARETAIPSLDQIGALLDSMPINELPKDRRMEQRLKHGKRSVILAVVDTGVSSFMRFSDAGFGGEKLFESKSAARGKKNGQKGPRKR